MYSFLLVLFIGSVVVSQTDACSCVFTNVTAVCNPNNNFAAKFKVKDSEVKSTDQFEGYIRYKLKILDFYKASGVNNRHNYFLDSKTNGGLCGLHLEVNEEYFLIGRASGKNKLVASSCSWYRKNGDESADDLAFLEKWEEHCCDHPKVITEDC